MALSQKYMCFWKIVKFLLNTKLIGFDGKSIFLPYLLTSEVGLEDIENRVNTVCLYNMQSLYYIFNVIYVLYLKGNFFPGL